MKKFLQHTLIIFSLLNIINIQTFAKYDIVNSPSQKEIADKYKLLEPLGTSLTYLEIPTDITAGALDNSTLNRALDFTNFIRFTAGLNEVTLNDDYNIKAQSASFLMYKNNLLTHYPERPTNISDEIYNLGFEGATNSNILRLSTIVEPAQSILSYINDSDMHNISTLGHRRWILNPYMAQTGFGQVGDFSAMYALDTTNNIIKSDAVTWPAHNMPIDFFDSNQAWSFSINKVLTGEISVNLTNINSGQNWILDKNNTDTQGEFFTVNNDGYGVRGCIIFRPSPNSVTYNANDIFEVIITQDKEIIAEYTVNFFDLNKVFTHSIFNDVDTSSKYYAPVVWAVNNNITTGTSENLFSPNDICTRGQIVTFLWRYFGCPEPKSTINPFTDVDENQYYYKAVLWAVENNITLGNGKGQFLPDDTCTFPQVLTFLWRTQDEPSSQALEHYYTDAVLWAENLGMFTAINKVFSENTESTRSDIVTFLYTLDNN